MFAIAPYLITAIQNGETIPLWDGKGKAGVAPWLFDHLSIGLGKMAEVDDRRRGDVG